MKHIPEWQMKDYDDMTDEEKTLYDAWDPTEEEAIAVSHAILQRACDEYGVTLEFTSSHGTGFTLEPSKRRVHLWKQMVTVGVFVMIFFVVAWIALLAWIVLSQNNTASLF